MFKPERNLVERGPPANTQRQTWEMVNSDVDGCTKTLNHRKILWKTTTCWKATLY